MDEEGKGVMWGSSEGGRGAIDCITKGPHPLQLMGRWGIERERGNGEKVKKDREEERRDK